MTDDGKSAESASEHNEFDQFEKLLKRVIVVPKSEIDAARQAEEQKPPSHKTA